MQLPRFRMNTSIGVSGAKAGTLSFLIGGSEEAFNRASPLLALMGKYVIRCGPSGSSSSVNNPVPGALSGKSPPCERDFDDGFATALMIKVCNVIRIRMKQFIQTETMG